MKHSGFNFKENHHGFKTIREKPAIVGERIIKSFYDSSSVALDRLAEGLEVINFKQRLKLK